LFDSHKAVIYFLLTALLSTFTVYKHAECREAALQCVSFNTRKRSGFSHFPYHQQMAHNVAMSLSFHSVSLPNNRSSVFIVINLLVQQIVRFYLFTQRVSYSDHCPDTSNGYEYHNGHRCPRL